MGNGMLARLAVGAATGERRSGGEAGGAPLIQPDSVARSRRAPWLICEACTARALWAPTARLHAFIETRQCGGGQESLYACSECGALRRWGLE